MNIVNLTPHALNIKAADAAMREIAPSGVVARVSESRESLGMLDGLAISRASYGDIDGLPDAAPDTIYVVSGLVLARTDRPDVFAPGPAIRDDGGRIIGADGLSASAGYVMPPAPPSGWHHPHATKGDAAPGYAPHVHPVGGGQVVLPADAVTSDAEGLDPLTTFVQMAGGEPLPLSKFFGGKSWIVEGAKYQLERNALGRLLDLPPEMYPIPMGLNTFGAVAQWADHKKWLARASQHPEFHKLSPETLGRLDPNSPFANAHHSTLEVVRDGVEDVEGLLGEYYHRKAAERSGVAEWLTPRNGQRVIMHAAAGGKRQWGILLPEGMQIEAQRRKGDVYAYEGVSFRQLFRKGGARDFKVAYVITGTGDDTLEIKVW